MRARRQGTTTDDAKSPEALPRGEPERGEALSLPPRRPTRTYGPKIVGSEGKHRVHVAVGRDTEGGEIVEVWIDVVHREGAPLRGFAHALARVASQALQHGTPLDVIVRSLVGTDGGPAGAVLDCEGVAEASSIPDLVGRVLAFAGGVPLPVAPEPIS